MLIIVFFFFLIDVEECESGENVCYVNVKCLNILGSYVCCCIWGFDGDGFMCIGNVFN